MSNTYPGYCLICGTYVQAKAGHYQWFKGRFVCRCKDCVGKGNKQQKET
jgi:hypothetical protein